MPRKLPKVLIAVSRPTFAPTVLREMVKTRTRNGPTIASNASGTKNNKAEVRSEPTAKSSCKNP